MHSYEEIETNGKKQNNLLAGLFHEFNTCIVEIESKIRVSYFSVELQLFSQLREGDFN
jgi:hypothetical protein